MTNPVTLIHILGQLKEQVMRMHRPKGRCRCMKLCQITLRGKGKEREGERMRKKCESELWFIFQNTKKERKSAFDERGHGE